MEEKATPQIKIRTATGKDLPVLNEFQQGVADAERPFNAAIRPDEVTYYDIAHLITDIKTLMLVAENEETGQLVGCGYAQIRDAKSYLSHSSFAYLGFMYVQPDFRGQGINGLILSDLKTWIRAKNIQEVRLDVYAGNAVAIKAYEKFGFSPLLIEMEMKIK